MPEPDYVVHLPPKAHATLRQLAELRGITLDEVIFEALSLGKAALEAKMRGSRLLLETRGHFEELYLVS